MKTYRPARQLLADVEKALAARETSARLGSPLDRVVEVLYQGRHYFWIGIYLSVDERLERQVFRGPVPPCHGFALGSGNVGSAGKTGVLKVVADVSTDPSYSMCFVETKSEMAVPIRIIARVLGVIAVESDRLNAFGGEDRVLLKEVATRLARFLTGRGKYLLLHARQAAAAENTPQDRHQPASEKSTLAAHLHLAAGQRSH